MLGHDGFKAFGRGVIRIASLPFGMLKSLSEKSAEEQKAYLKTLLDTPYIAESIFLASPGLYDRLSLWKGGGEDYNQIERAFLRYLKRMSDRATPFGSFSAIGTVSMTGSMVALCAPPAGQMKLRLRLSSTVVSDLCDELKSREIRNLPLRANDTIYKKGDTFSYISFDDLEKGLRVYKSIEVEAEPELEFVLHSAQAGASFEELVEALCKELSFQALRPDVESYIDSLIKAQLLVSDDMMCLISGGMLESLIRASNRAKLDGTAALEKIEHGLHQLELRAPGVPVSMYKEYLYKNFDGLVSADGKPILQADLYAGPAPGEVNATISAAIERAVSTIYSFAEPLPWHLKEFAARFTDKYGDGEVPLLELLDVHEGLDYDVVTTPSTPLIDAVFGRGKKNPGVKVRSHDIKERLLDLLGRSRAERTRYLSLPAEFLGKSDPAKREHNQFALAWCALWDGGDDDQGRKRVIPEIRSVTFQDPCRIFGRFANEDSEIKGLMEDIRKRDRTNAMVAEVVHLPERKYGNLTSRPLVGAEAVVTIRAGAPSGVNQVLLADLMVSVDHSRVVLRSRALNRFVSLRMSNAHNTKRKWNSGIYKFLNAISTQHSGILSPLTFRRWFPQERFLPGILVDGVLVSRPTWRISHGEIDQLRKATARGRREWLQHFRAEHELPVWCALVSSENDQSFCLDSSWMVEELIRELLASEEALLTEACPDGMEPAVKSELGAHRHELLVAFENERFSLPPGRSPQLAPYALKALGSEWLYFKVYAKPRSQNQALMEIAHVLRASESIDVPLPWFFVRYSDGKGAHLRIRINGDPSYLLSHVLPRLVEVVHKLVDRRIATDFAIDTYQQEVLRYGGVQRFRIFEKIFALDSRAYLHLLENPDVARFHDWEIGSISADALLNSLGLESLEEKLAFAKRAAEDYARELRFDSTHRKAIGGVHRKFSLADIHSRSSGISSIVRSLADDVASTWSRLDVEGLTSSDLYGLRWSVIHMHFNRICEVAQRRHEAIVWDLLRREYLALLAKSKMALSKVFSAESSPVSS